MKKILTFLLVLALLVAPQTMLAESYDYNELVVGSSMPTSGAFFTDMWGNNSADIDVRDMIHGYNLVYWNAEIGGYDFDRTVINEPLITEDEDGNHVFNIILYEDLRYSDGSRITAWDYAFSILLRIAPQIEELGGLPLQADYILGYEDYLSGNTPFLAGVRVPANNQIVITIDHEYLPYFFEMALIDCVPYPMSVIAPGTRIADDGKGVYLTKALSAAQLQQTILDENSGYQTHPKVTSGPYKLTAYDGQQATFERNPYYKGNAKGVKPVIQRVIFRHANEETMVDELFSGEYGLLNKATTAQLIQAGLDGIEQDPTYAATPYGRTGLGFITFNTEKTALQSMAVREAIGKAIDKDNLAKDYVGDFGDRVDGYYGLGQWMYLLLKDSMDHPETTQDLEAAAKLLEEDGWTLNREGGEYDAANDDVRCKQVGDEIVALDLKLEYAEGIAIGEELEKWVVAPLAEVGIKLTAEASDDLLKAYYEKGERECDMFFMASNLGVVFDPSNAFAPGNIHNLTRVEDEQLYELAVDMRRTEPGDVDEYCRKWQAFQARFNELAPIVPLYSNEYYDFYTLVLHDYDILTSTSWADAIVSSSMSAIE